MILGILTALSVAVGAAPTSPTTTRAIDRMNTTWPLRTSTPPTNLDAALGSKDRSPGEAPRSRPMRDPRQD